MYLLYLNLLCLAHADLLLYFANTLFAHVKHWRKDGAKDFGMMQVGIIVLMLYFILLQRSEVSLSNNWTGRH